MCSSCVLYGSTVICGVADGISIVVPEDQPKYYESMSHVLMGHNEEAELAILVKVRCIQLG